jgi:hypothetical protein
MSDSIKRSRIKFLLLALLFFGPVMFAWWAYYYSDGWRPAGQTEHGDLLSPAIALPEFDLPTGADAPLTLANLQGKWTLLYLDGWDCDTSCVDALYNTRQVRLGECCELRDLSSDHPDLAVAWLLGDGAKALLAAMPRYDQVPPQLAGRIYIVDPRGNLIMSYPPAFEPKGLLKDMKKLLKLSHIG